MTQWVRLASRLSEPAWNNWGRIDGRNVPFDLRWSKPADATLMQAYAAELVALIPRRYLGQCQHDPRVVAAGDARRCRLQCNKPCAPRVLTHDANAGATPAQLKKHCSVRDRCNSVWFLRDFHGADPRSRRRDHYPLQRWLIGALCDAVFEYHLRPLLSSVRKVSSGAWDESTGGHRPS
jgi:hypothetical protein